MGGCGWGLFLCLSIVVISIGRGTKDVLPWGYEELREKLKCTTIKVIISVLLFEPRAN